MFRGSHVADDGIDQQLSHPLKHMDEVRKRVASVHTTQMCGPFELQQT